VTLTRCLHAQLEQQGAAFAPPQHLANAWKNHLTRSSDKIKSKDSPSTESAWLCPETETNDFEFEEAVGDFSSFERGLRLTAAFEMLYQVNLVFGEGFLSGSILSTTFPYFASFFVL